MSHLHRHEDGLCAACGKGATRLALFTIKQIDDHLNHFGVHLSHGGVNGGVERVGVCPHTVALANEVCMVRPVRVAVVYRSADLPTSPVPKEEGEYVAPV